MTNVEFGDLRDRGDGLDIVEGQTMTCMGFDAIFCRKRGRICNPAQFGLGPFAIAIEQQMGIFTSVEFDNGSFELDRSVNLPGVGFDEQADADS